jgi:iron complex outermembrane receptor protein
MRPKTMLKFSQTVLLLMLALFGPETGWAQPAKSRDLTEASLEDLMNIQVTSVSKKEQKLSRTGAAVYVITQEDIRRSGASNIPDLLRMAPGVDVAQIDAHTWAIAIRGFNDRYANKVLVLIDGRSVFSPTTSGVNWDQQELPLENIERIEVMRGPGGTVWGANAVNGVINIITKSAEDTQGGLVSAGAGSREAGRGLLQYGGKLGGTGTYRVFGDYFDIRNSSAPNGKEGADGWHASRGGFRSDWNPSPRDTLTVEGDLFQTHEDQTISTLFSNALFARRIMSDPVTVGAGDILGVWNHMLKNGSDMTLQAYYDRYDRLDLGVRERRNTVDFDFHHHFKAGNRHDIVWGVGYRITSDHFLPGYGATYVPLHRADSLFSGFVQDEIRLGDKLWLTVGSKFEHNAYTGFEYEPSAQLVWTPTDRQTVWMSAARAIRQPARSEFGLQVDVAAFPLPNGGLGVVKLMGADNKDAEQVHDYGIGYRTQPNRRLSFDLAGFLSHYGSSDTVEPGTPYLVSNPAPPHVVFPNIFDDQAHARTYGVEAFGNWKVTSHWRISPGYSMIRLKVTADPSSRDANPELPASKTPEQQFQVHSFLNLTHNLDWDSAVFYVGSLREASMPTPSYTRLDTRIAWRLSEYLELSIAGQNLLSPRHAEFQDANGQLHTLVQRSVFGKVTWRF